MRDYRPYIYRCISCGRGETVQAHGERCVSCQKLPPRENYWSSSEWERGLVIDTQTLERVGLIELREKHEG